MGGGSEARRNRHVDGSAMGNLSATTCGVGAGEDLGGEGLTGGPRLSATAAR
jgi:hypothetical protein